MRGLAPEAASAIVGAALVAAGVPAGIAATVAGVAPRLLEVLADLIDAHARGAPLPAIERAELPDDGAILAWEVEKLR